MRTKVINIRKENYRMYIKALLKNAKAIFMKDKNMIETNFLFKERKLY